MMLTDRNALFWALLVIPILALYAWRIRPRRYWVTTGSLWARVFSSRQPRSLWRRWRRPASLAVQWSILCAMVLALAEPCFRRPLRVAVVIDNAASMNATDMAPSRLDQAKQFARQWVDALGYRDQVAILSGGDPIQVHLGLTSHRALLQQAIDAIEPTDRAHATWQAVGVARRLLTGDPDGKILVVSDGCFDRAEELANAEGVEFVAVGSEGDNLAVTRLAARRSPVDPLRCQVLAELTSRSNGPADCRLQFELDGKPIDTADVRLPGGGRWQQVYEFASAGAGRLTARLDRPDAFPADNSAAIAVPPGGPCRVVLVDRAKGPLRKALEANARVKLSLAETPPASLDAGTILVLSGTSAERLPEGPVLVVDPAGPSSCWELGDLLPDPVVARQDESRPLWANVRLVGLRWAGARRIIPAETVRSISRAVAWTADGTPLAYEIARPAGKVVVLAGNAEAGDLAAHGVLPILLANAVTWLRAGEGDSPSLADRSAVPGEPGPSAAIEIRVPAALRDRTLQVPEAPAGAPWSFLVAAAMAMLVVEWGLFQRRWVC